MNKNDFDFEITAVSPWIAVSTIPTKDSKLYNELIEKYGPSGVYQIAEKKDIDDIGENLVDPNIGYIGKSQNVLNRTYGVRAEKGDHGAGRYIRQNDLSRDEVMIRYIYTPRDEITGLEDNIHDLMRENYGYRFKWTEASAGNAGNYSMVLDYAEKLTAEELIDLIPELKQIAVRKNQEEFLSKISDV